MVKFKYLAEESIYILSYNKIAKDYYQVICTDSIRPNEIRFIAIVHHTKEESHIFKYIDVEMCIIANGIDFNKLIIESLDKLTNK